MIEIRNSYTTVSKIYHPDKNSKYEQDVAKFNFLRIKFAYNILMDPEQRDFFCDEIRIKLARR